jgi:DNA replicative helicase MCM subunit Mcm2 (Cdc46/Mcm family)
MELLEVEVEESRRERKELRYDDRARLLHDGQVSGNLVLCTVLTQTLQEADQMEEEDGQETLREYVAQQDVRVEIQSRFENFLRTHTNEKGEAVFQMMIKNICRGDRSSFEVDYNILTSECPTVAFLLAVVPRQVLEIFEEAALQMALDIDKNYQEQVVVRISELPLPEALSGLGAHHRDQLVRTSVVVTSSGGAQPQLYKVDYACKLCGYVLGPFYQEQNEENLDASCPECSSHGSFEMNPSVTLYKDCQWIAIEESPDQAAAGQPPRSLDVLLCGELSNRCGPGDEIDLTGIFSNSYDYTSTRTDIIIANHVVELDVEDLPPGLPRGSGLRTLKARIDNLMRQVPRTEVVRRQLETQRWLYRQLLAGEKENIIMEGEEPRKRRKPAASGDGPSRKSSRLESAATTLGGSVSGHEVRQM